MTQTTPSSVDAMRQALEDVCNPLGYLRRKAEAEGNRLGGMAYAIANDIATVQQIARDALSTLPSDGVTIPAGWVLVPDGDPVSLAECPPGPFAIGDNLGFKTEYGAMSGKDVGCGTVEWTVTHWPDAYCLDSGESFWGGASTREARAALIVQPLAAALRARAALLSDRGEG